MQIQTLFKFICSFRHLSIPTEQGWQAHTAGFGQGALQEGYTTGPVRGGARQWSLPPGLLVLVYNTNYWPKQLCKLFLFFENNTFVPPKCNLRKISLFKTDKSSISLVKAGHGPESHRLSPWATRQPSQGS